MHLHPSANSKSQSSVTPEAYRPLNAGGAGPAGRAPPIQKPSFSYAPGSARKQTEDRQTAMSTHQFSRRTFLRGLGVTMALPWMESMTVWGDTPPVGVRPGSEAPVRLAVLFSGNGFHSKEWWAKGEGRQMELGK